MYLKYFYDPKLAHASYLVGCQRSNEALIVDPGRDIEQYLAAARAEGFEITAVAETHIHADYVSGARELAERVGAKLYVSDEGPAEWKYEYLADYQHQLLHDGESFKLGNLRFDVLHTPGHTPESISFLLTDLGGGADQPMGIFTGDFVFVGSIGRPDLLEEAAGLTNTAEPGARDLYQSVERFKALPDYLQVWPAHGAGSACGKGLGAVPSSTVGYERMFNPALQFHDEDAFVKYILADQPEAPKYFAVMKRVNKEGPKILGTESQPPALAVAELEGAIQAGTVVDLSAPADFAHGHWPGTINIPLELLAGWAGWLVDYTRPAYLIGLAAQIDEATRILHKIGVENLAGSFDAAEVKRSSQSSAHYRSAEPQQVADLLDQGRVQLLDVRSQEEWLEGHIAQAKHQFLGRLPDHLDELDAQQTIVVQCRSGARAGIAASILQAAGYSDVINMMGGYVAWKAAGLPTVKPQMELSGS